MSYSGLVIVLFATAAGCASAGSGQAEGDDQQEGSDAAPTGEDAQHTTEVDAAPPIDAPPACVTMTKNLLTNGNFDGTPTGTGWTLTPYQAGDQLVTSTAPLIQTVPNAAWLGGLASASLSVKAADVVYQDIAVPASASTPLVLAGFYEIRTGESATAPMNYDTVTVELLSSTGAVLETLLSKGNIEKTTVFTALDKTLTATYAGQTVRLRITSQNDFSLPTSFYFDSLALSSTVCE